MPHILEPLKAIELVYAFSKWRGGSLELKNKYIIQRISLMLAKVLPTGLVRKEYQQTKEMKGRDILYIMSKERFIYFLHQLGNTPKTYQFGTPGNGTNVEYKVKIQIMITTEVGLSSSPENYARLLGGSIENVETWATHVRMYAPAEEADATKGEERWEFP